VVNTPAVPDPVPALSVASRPPLDIGPRIRPELGLLAGGTLLLAATNALGLTEGNPRASGSGLNTSNVAMARPLFQRAIQASVGYSF